jgi:hypothetical protein
VLQSWCNPAKGASHRERRSSDWKALLWRLSVDAANNAPIVGTELGGNF